MSYIEAKNLTKDFGQGRGIFDLSLSIEKGEAFGFVGTNGAGKSTTLRHLMGFLKPQSGTASINGLDCWDNAAKIKSLVGYVPGEIAFPDAPTGNDFIKRQADLLGLKELSYAHSIVDKLQLDPSANLKRMSKGMKQKTALVAAFMTHPEILILDEPTTGLDPLMRAEFMDLLLEEKKSGKTILMSSHLFEEVEDVCDNVALIKNGKIIDVKSTREIRHNEDKSFKIEFNTQEDYQRFIKEDFDMTEKRNDQNQAIVSIHDSHINVLTRTLTGYDVKFITEIKYTLEAYFKNFY